MLAIIETYEGPCLIGRGRCGVCGWEGVDAFDVGLEALGGGEWAYDRDAAPACPRCTLHEVAVKPITPASA